MPKGQHVSAYDDRRQRRIHLRLHGGPIIQRRVVVSRHRTDRRAQTEIPDGAATTVSLSPGAVVMDESLLEAATSGDTTSSSTAMELAVRDPGVLLATTPRGNTCLHIASACGHQGFCERILELNPSLLTAVNKDHETPLVTAVISGHASLASVLLMFCGGNQQLMSDVVLQKDKNGCNALHHAIHGGHEALALELIATAPALSRVVNDKGESPMFIAVLKNLIDVVVKLLEVSDSAHGGPRSQNALHAAVIKGNPDIVRRIMEARPRLAREENVNKFSPMSKATHDGKIDIVTLLLEHDRSLGYLISSTDVSLLNNAAAGGHVGIARELLKRCPDAPYRSNTGWTCLHSAVSSGQAGFVQFVVGSKQLQPLVNMQNQNGWTALHIAALKRNSRIISILLLHQGIDLTLLDNNGKTAWQILAAVTKDDDAKDTIWIPDGVVSPGAVVVMDGRLLQAATSGDTSSIAMELALRDPGVLLARTPQGNTCLHMASARGHQGFCERILELNLSLLTAVNKDNETPLVTAVISGHASLASVFLMFCGGNQQLMSDVVLQKDKNGCNALHHAIHGGHEALALELIATAPALSRDVNSNEESPMFVAAVKNLADVVGKLLEISDSAHGGPDGQNALHAAVGKGNPDIVRRIMEARPLLAREENVYKFSPVSKATHDGKIDIVTLLLEHDRSLGYLMSSTDVSLLNNAAAGGHVAIARQLLKRCPDAPYRSNTGWTCLHTAVSAGQAGFVQFVQGSKQLQPLVNMQDSDGWTALHVAAREGNSCIFSALLLHQGIDITLLDSNGKTAWQVLAAVTKDDNKNSIWIPDGESVSPGAVAMMDGRLLHAATSGIMDLALGDPGLLLGRTPQGNTCLHVASTHGHQGFCERVLEQNKSLIETVNIDGETPLLTTVTSGHVPLALFLLRYCLDRKMRGTIIKQDKRGCNVLHHAIRSGHKDLAIQLIDAEPALSNAVNKHDESPMFIAVMRDFTDVFKKLLEIPDSAHGGASGHNALHAAVRNGNQDIAEQLVRSRPALAREENKQKLTPLHFAATENKVDVLEVLLRHDFSLGFLVSTDGAPLLNCAACRGHVDFARELLKHCPDAPYLNYRTGMTCLHQAVYSGRKEFVEFVVQSAQLRKLINMRDKDGDTALHYAKRKCDPKIVAALMDHQDIDLTVLNDDGRPPVWVPDDAAEHAKTLNGDDYYEGASKGKDDTSSGEGLDMNQKCTNKLKRNRPSQPAKQHIVDLLKQQDAVDTAAVDETGLDPHNINMVKITASVSRTEAVRALKKHKGGMDSANVELTDITD